MHLSAVLYNNSSTLMMFMKSDINCHRLTAKQLQLNLCAGTILLSWKLNSIFSIISLGKLSILLLHVQYLRVS